ncbi:MAG: Lrp/AsnC family transcriptional regulator [Rhodospirillales bacterium]|jgi:DNA-binding Lrp family transcriptional regulator|nr:Lrp/AsnC family transcriptional regulator [Rhodospirillales bacterium]
MDDLDRELISLLRSDARMPVSSLAPRLGVSRATVRARINRLQESGTIQGFTLALGKAPGSQVRAITTLKVEGQAAESVFRRLTGYSEVHALYSTNGRWDIVVEIEATNLETFDVLLRDIRRIDGVSDSETSILLASRKSVKSAEAANIFQSN